MTPARPLSPPVARVRPPGRGGVGGDALVAVVLGAALLAGGWVDVRAYRAARGKTLPAFRLVGTPIGERVGQDEFFHETSTLVHLGNVGGLEQDDPRDKRTRFRQALGPVSTVEIWSRLKRARLAFTYRSPVADQTVTVACNGQTLEEIHLHDGEDIAREYALDLQPRANQFTLTFSRYSSHGFELNNPDKRAIAGRFFALDLYLPDPQGNL